MSKLELPDLTLSPEEARRVRDANPPTVAEVHVFHINMTWSWKGCGFGELYVRFNPDAGTYSFDTEAMSKDSVRKFLRALADHVADHVDDNLEIKP
jgi:hypothetical protein